jgi:hypothetical protein
MPLDIGSLNDQLRSHEDAIREYVNQGRDLVTDYREALREEHQRRSADEVTEAVSGTFANALPTEEFETLDGLTATFESSEDWQSHEAAGRWASDALDGLPTIAVDGSETPPTDELNVLVALTRVAYYVNHHTPEAEFDRGDETELLPPAKLVRSPATGSYSYVDPDEAKHARYEEEAKKVVELIEEYADTSPPPVVLYDGSLNVSYTNLFDDEVTDRYTTAMGRILAASRANGVPVVGYIAGSRASDVANLVQELHPTSLGADPLPLDGVIFRPWLETWGSRTALFVNRRDQSLDELQVSYRGEEYDFADRLLFSYVDLGEGELLERLEVPRWTIETAPPSGWKMDCENMFEYAYQAVLGEAAVGQGYPEALQQVDADAVLGTSDREQLLQLLQQFGNESGIDITWNAKDQSKRRRR